MQRLWIILWMLIVASTPFLFSQEAKKAFTNTDVVKLVQASLPDSTIVLVIEQSPARFDTSPAALIELKKQGVSQVVMEAMLHSSSQPDAVKPANAASVPVTAPGPSDIGTDILAEGTYYKSPAGWVKLEQLTM